MKNIIKKAWLLAAVLSICGCAHSTMDLHALSGFEKLPANARVGLAQFKKCGGVYLDRLNLEYYQEDAKAIQFLKCTEEGKPKIFDSGLRHHLEERLGTKLVVVKSAQPYRPEQLLVDAELLHLEYIVSGDLLFLVQNDRKTAVSVFFYMLRVADGKVLMKGWVKKTGAAENIKQTIDEVANELYAKLYGE